MNQTTVDLIKARILQIDTDLKWVENKILEEEKALELSRAQRSKYKLLRAELLETLMEAGIDYDSVQS